MKSNQRAVRQRKQQQREFADRQARRQEPMHVEKKGVFDRLMAKLDRMLSVKPKVDMRDGGMFGGSKRRDAGANQLRAWFPALGKMVSTRDGKPV